MQLSAATLPIWSFSACVARFLDTEYFPNIIQVTRYMAVVFVMKSLLKLVQFAFVGLDFDKVHPVHATCVLLD